MEPDPISRDAGEGPIVVIGGGPAGSTCARELARRGHEVVLLDHNVSTGPRPGETSGPGLRRILEGGCGLLVPPEVAAPLPVFFSAWGGPELDGRAFSFWNAGAGLVLDRRAFDEWLLREAAAAGVSVLRGCRVVGGIPGEHGSEIHARAGTGDITIKSSFVVEATGRSSRSAVQPNLKRFYTDDLICLAVEFPSATSGDAMAAVEACQVGWWYTVRSPDGRQVVALFTDADALPPRDARPAWFRSMLRATTHIGKIGGYSSSDTGIQTWDARTSVHNVFWRGRWLPIGDAAFSIDPLAGAGIERAVGDGVDAAAVISRALVLGEFEGLRSFALSHAESFRKNLATQRRYYAAEGRWKNDPFWERRGR